MIQSVSVIMDLPIDDQEDKVNEQVRRTEIESPQVSVEHCISAFVVVEESLSLATIPLNHNIRKTVTSDGLMLSPKIYEHYQMK